MGEENKTQIRTEGQPAFPAADTEKDTSAASSAGEETGDGREAGDDKDRGLADHPRWKEREEAWNKRFNEQEERHQSDLKAIREEFSQRREAAPSADDKIPSWFGGTKEQWKEYCAYEQQKIDDAQKRAEENAVKRIKGESEAETKAIQEATEYLRSEIAAIEGDKSLNPTGAKFDKALTEKLLAFTLENDLVDSKQRWNYRAAWRMMQAQEHTRQSHAGNRKEVAAATTTRGAGGESKPAPFKTSEDFKKGKRPW